MKKPMNFLFINPDEMRAESVGCYGHPLSITPSMDRLASEGVLFEQCHVQHTVCSPSRCSMMTGWYPHVAGHRTLWHLLRPHEPNLFQLMKEAGWFIYWDGGHNDLLAAACFERDVSSLKNSGKGYFGKNPYDPEDPRYHSFLYEPYTGPIEEHGDYAKILAAIDFLRSDPKEPFLIYLPLIYPHPPYSAPPHWHRRFRPEDLPPLKPPLPEGKPQYHGLIRESRRLDQVDEEHLRRIQAVYLGMIGFMDEMIGFLLDALNETGHAEDTAVVLYSDHGDWAGDYGLVEKWPSGLDDALTRVPLVIRAPGCRAGHRVMEPMELFDVMPTTLEMAGLSARHSHFSRSLVPQLQGAPGDPDRAVFAEGGYDAHEPHCFEGMSSEGTPEHEKRLFLDPKSIYYPKSHVQLQHPASVCRSVMIRTAAHKLIRRTSGENELYDLGADPDELENRYEEPRLETVRKDLEDRLLDWYLHTSDVVPLDKDKRGIPG